MDQNQPVEVMFPDIEEVQMFLLAHPEAGQELADTDLISYALIKINNMNGMYINSLERWNPKALTNLKTWSTFRKHMIVKFEKLIASSARPTLVQEIYSGAYNMMEAADDGDSLAKSIVHYNERVTVSDIKVSNLERRLSQLEMGGPPMLAPQQQQMANYMPETAYITHAPARIQIPTMVPVQPPKNLQSPQTPQQWKVQTT